MAHLKIVKEKTKNILSTDFPFLDGLNLAGNSNVSNPTPHFC